MSTDFLGSCPQEPGQPRAKGPYLRMAEWVKHFALLGTRTCILRSDPQNQFKKPSTVVHDLESHSTDMGVVVWGRGW